MGTVNIPIIYKSVDWWYSLHQGASIKFTGASSIDSSMLYPLLLMYRGLLLPVHLPAVVQYARTDPAARTAQPLGASVSRVRPPDVFRFPGRPLWRWTGTVGYVWTAYLMSLLVLAILIVYPRRRQRRLLREVRGELRRRRRFRGARQYRGILSHGHASETSTTSPGSPEHCGFLVGGDWSGGLLPAQQHQSVLPAGGRGGRQGTAGYTDSGRRYGGRGQRSALQ